MARISKSIINYVDSHLENYSNSLELAYMIYVLINKVLCYSPNFAFSKNNEVPSIEEVTLTNPYVNCHTWSALYCELLSHYGVYSKVVNDELHSHVEIFSDGVIVVADATKVLLGDGMDYTSDLCNYKFGFKGVSFNIDQRYTTESSRDMLHLLKEKVLSVLGVNSNQEKDLVEYLTLYVNSETKEDQILLGVGLLNNVYSSIKGASIEKRQILEKYFSSIFGEEYKYGYKYMSMYSIENSNKVPHRLIFFDTDNVMIPVLEETNGIRVISLEEIFNMYKKGVLFFKYTQEKDAFMKLYGKENRPYVLA